MATRLEVRAIELFNKHRDPGFASSDPAKQIEHLLEEVGEFVAAVMRQDSSEALMEAGDVAWLLVDILNVMDCKYLLAVGMEMSLDKIEARHTETTKPRQQPPQNPMLVACKRLLAHCVDDLPVLPVKYQAAVNQARAAIAKAEGEPK